MRISVANAELQNNGKDTGWYKDGTGIWVRMVSRGMLVIRVDQKGVLQLKHVCVTKKKSKCVIICTPRLSSQLTFPLLLKGK